MVSVATASAGPTTSVAPLKKGTAEARTYHDDMKCILWTASDLASRISELGRQIAADYEGKAPLVLGVLKGSFMFYSDLVRAIEPCPRGLTMDFIRASSYGSGTESTGDVKLKTDLKKEKVAGRHVILVEDIVDTALTITTVIRYLQEECDVASVRTATLLDKHERRVINYKPEYVGFTCPNEFVVGYGLDFDEEYRSIPYIGVLKPECYAHLGIKPEPAESGESGDE
ncbi:hypothetical protein HYH02_004555 [Chlamydomonas schloesseri]|uniref:Hypoxanthine phosphoribosyltransferase n=1 Tax=Chlamydomonas schloesseri TaxID=2026947 RepID=A0A835WN45_9CHLO|nr:hypothetical protein HYH02_004555 [Chlamydomonas schloesseri]|eukprot:KAG2450717.1 hypothetical protein HYH02_004555 [Chlamydomonas schloesseri]